MIGCFKKKRENCPTKCFWTKKKKIRIKNLILGQRLSASEQLDPQNISHFPHSFNITYTNWTHVPTDYRRENSFNHLKGWLSSNEKNLWKVKTTTKSCPNLPLLTLFCQEMNNVQLQQLQQEEATRIRLNQNVNKLEHQVQNLTTVSSVWSSPLNQQHFSYKDEATW